MLSELTYIFNTFLAVFVIVDPFAVVPVYLSLTERFSLQEKRAIQWKASLVALCMLSAFALTGLAIFDVFGITIPAFQIAGGILLFLIGAQQLNSKRQRVRRVDRDEGLAKDDISIFPLGTPLLAGPGAISTVVLASAHAHNYLRKGELLLAIVLVMISCYFIIKVAPMLFRVLGNTGLNLLTRIMGLILTAIAVQFVLNGLKGAIEMLQAAKVL